MYSTWREGIRTWVKPVKEMHVVTYIRVPPDLLDDLVIKVARVADEVGADLVGVLQAAEDVVNQATLPEVGALRLTVRMNLLNPSMVGLNLVVVDMLLELDDVRVGDNLGVRR
jgi:hypothetical protein